MYDDLATLTPPATADRCQTSLIGSSPALLLALRDLPAVTESPAPVLLLGESGTGKELVARAIHVRGRRRRGPFVAVNCAAIPGGLFESELFGHDAGAYSGALRQKPGLLEAAHRGTMFLDEIGDLPPALQAKLLRVLDDGEVRRLGETVARKADFRLICATNRDLRREVDAARFRLDLFYRINVFTLSLPPLRERVSDIPELAAHLVARVCEQMGRPRPVISAAAMDELVSHDWPGNVRELANVVERAVALVRDGVIEPWHVALERRAQAAAAKPSPLRFALADVERDLVNAALLRHAGNVSAASRELGIARQQVQRLMRRHGLKLNGAEV